jgi:MoaA/NifB/PqqE/SkfB family radical SAM enzyme
LTTNKLLRNEDQHYDAWLQWNVTSQCNFDCIYCFGKIPVNKADLNVIHIEKLISTLDKTGMVFRIGFTGGEPLLIPNIIDACAELTKKHYVSFNTNLITPVVKEFAERINPARVLNIHASLHFEELLERKLMDNFVNNYKMLDRKGFNIYAEAVAWPGLSDRVTDYKRMMDSFGIDFVFAPYIGNNKVLDYPEVYSEKELAAYNLAGDNLSWFRQKGERCNAAFNAGVVFSNGDVYPCFQIKEKIGNVYEEIRFNNDMTLCPAKRCACPLNKYDDYLFSKASPGSE